MELPNKTLEQIAFNTRPEVDEKMLTVMDKSIHEEHLPQPLQTNNKQFKIAVTFLTSYNGISNVTNYKIINSILQDHLMMMILLLLLFHPAHTNPRAWTMKLKQIIHFKSNQIFQLYDILYKFSVKDHWLFYYPMTV